MTHDPAPWPENDVRAAARSRVEPAGGADEYAQLHAAHRRFEDRLAASALPDDVSRQVTGQLTELADTLAGYEVSEWERRDGWRVDLPGRGMVLIPPYTVDDEGGGRISGRVTFTRMHLGGNNTAHGGTQPLLFDDILGRALNDGLPGVARTAYLHVDYRRVTPLGVELRFEAVRDRVEGRKRFGTARILDQDGAVLVEATALFVQLNLGQP